MVGEASFSARCQGSGCLLPVPRTLCEGKAGSCGAQQRSGTRGLAVLAHGGATLGLVCHVQVSCEHRNSRGSGSWFIRGERMGENE